MNAQRKGVIQMISDNKCARCGSKRKFKCCYILNGEVHCMFCRWDVLREQAEEGKRRAAQLLAEQRKYQGQVRSLPVLDEGERRIA